MAEVIILPRWRQLGEAAPVEQQRGAAHYVLVDDTADDQFVVAGSVGRDHRSGPQT